METKSFDLLYGSFYKNIYGFVYSRVSEKEEVHDIVQEVFVTAYKTFDLSIYDEDVKAKKFLFTIARHRLIDYFRKKGRSPQTVNIESFDDNESNNLDLLRSESKTPEELFEQNEKKEEAVKLLNLIDEKDRNLLIMRFIEEMDYSDLADIFETSEEVIRQRVKRALSKIKKNYEKE